jgi:glycosyltransferase involved in cell wall biosynthesis
VNQLLSLSIVTPSFNQGAYIGEALRSVQGQRYPCSEHIVMDGGSTDDTSSILSQHAANHTAGVLSWVSEPDHGQGDALNKGFARAQGDVVGWLNSDDRYRTGCFETVAEYFASHPQVDILYGDYTWMDEGGNISHIRREIEFNRFILLYHRVLYIPTTATFFRRRIFDEGNYLDVGLHYAMDFEFFVRLARSGYRFQHIPELLADFRFHSQSKTCTMSGKQLDEKDRIMLLHSPVMRRLQSPAQRRVANLVLRNCAAAMRYSQKLWRGYYFEELHDAIR